MFSYEYNEQTKTHRKKHQPYPWTLPNETEALANAIGVSQQTISNIENSETVEDDNLLQIAKALGVSVEAIKNFTEEAVINYFNNYYDNKGHILNSCNQITFNPFDKLLEAHEENK